MKKNLDPILSLTNDAIAHVKTQLTGQPAAGQVFNILKPLEATLEDIRAHLIAVGAADATRVQEEKQPEVEVAKEPEPIQPVPVKEEPVEAKHAKHWFSGHKKHA